MFLNSKATSDRQNALAQICVEDSEQFEDESFLDFISKRDYRVAVSEFSTNQRNQAQNQIFHCSIVPQNCKFRVKGASKTSWRFQDFQIEAESHNLPEVNMPFIRLILLRINNEECAHSS